MIVAGTSRRESFFSRSAARSAPRRRGQGSLPPSGSNRTIVDLRTRPPASDGSDALTPVGRADDESHQPCEASSAAQVRNGHDACHVGGRAVDLGDQQFCERRLLPVRQHDTDNRRG